MTEIEDLIEQAQETLKRWHKPDRDRFEPPRALSWRQVLEERQYPSGIGYKIK